MKNAERSEYLAPVLDIQEMVVESGYGNSVFGVGSEEIGDLEELN
jgi:hypothetical protein